MNLNKKFGLGIVSIISVASLLMLFQNAGTVGTSGTTDPRYIPKPFLLHLKVKLPPGFHQNIQNILAEVQARKASGIWKQANNAPLYSPFFKIVVNGDQTRPVGCIPILNTNPIDPLKLSETNKDCKGRILNPTWTTSGTGIYKDEFEVDIDFHSLIDVDKNIIDVVSELSPNSLDHRSIKDGDYVPKSTTNKYFSIQLQFFLKTALWKYIWKDLRDLNAPTQTSLYDVPGIALPSEDQPLIVSQTLKYENGRIETDEAQLIGSTLGYASSRDLYQDTTPVLPYRLFNKRTYWDARIPAIKARLGAKEFRTPKHIIVSDRFVSDDNLFTLREGLENISELGVNTMGALGSDVLSSKAFHDALLSSGIKNIEIAAKNSHECMFTFDEGCDDPNEKNLLNRYFIKSQLDAAIAMGFDYSQIKMVRFFDEPGWSFPYYLDILKWGQTAGPFQKFFYRDRNPDPTINNITPIPDYQVAKNLTAFQEYLRKNEGVSSLIGNQSIFGPADVQGPHGAGTNDQWKRQGYYWTQRYFPYDAGVSYKKGLDYLQSLPRWSDLEQRQVDIPLVANVSDINNTFVDLGFTKLNMDLSNRTELPETFYFQEELQHKYEGARYNDMGFGAFDYFQMARLGQLNYLWSEDWLSEDEANFSTYQSSMLRSAARYVNNRFGSIVVGLSTHRPQNDMRYIQRAMAPIANGSKYIFHYTFGPAYAFPKNSYSDNENDIYRGVAETNSLIAKAEDVLFPGRSNLNYVGIVLPRSSYIWSNRPYDGITKRIANDLALTEHQYFYQILQHANIPVDYIDEDLAMNAAELSRFKVIYVTGRNIPRKAQANLLAWAQAGGSLVLSPSAGSYDEYDVQTKYFEAAAGIQKVDYNRSLVIGRIKIADNQWNQIDTGPRSDLVVKSEIGSPADFMPYPSLPREEVMLAPKSTAEVIASFGTGKKRPPAIVRNNYGLGKIYYYGIFMGYDYEQTALHAMGGSVLDISNKKYSKTARQWFTLPIWNYGYRSPVQILSVKGQTDWQIETPVLYNVGPKKKSESMAITVFDWGTTGSFKNLPKTVNFKIRLPTIYYQVDKIVLEDVDHNVGQELKNYTFLDANERYISLNADIKNIAVIKVYISKK